MLDIGPAKTTKIDVASVEDPSVENHRKTVVKAHQNCVVEATYKSVMEDTVNNEDAVVNTVSAVEVIIDIVTGRNGMVDTGPGETTNPGETIVMRTASEEHTILEIPDKTVGTNLYWSTHLMIEPQWLIHLGQWR